MAKILIVDDSLTARTQLRNELQGAGYEIIEAKNGQEGLDRVQENADLAMILSDVNMPVLDGLTMCEKLYENEDFRRIPKFMITTEAHPAMKERAKKVGVIGWIVKPFSSQTLLSAVQKVIGPAKEK